MSSYKSPKQYLGVLPRTPPNFTRQGRAPTTSDFVGYNFGDIWQDTTTNLFYSLAAVASNSATWVVSASQIIPATLTNHGVLLGQGTATIVATAAGTNGQVLVGSTGADPVFATIGSSDGSVTATTGAGSLTLQTTQATTTQLGGVNLATNSEARIGTSTTKVMTPDDFVKAGPNNYIDILFNQNCIAVSNSSAAGVATGNSGDTNLIMVRGQTYQQFLVGAQTIIKPAMSTVTGSTGMLFSLDLTNTKGAEYTRNVSASGVLGSAVIGTTAAFFYEVKFQGGAAANAGQMLMGLRKQEAFQAAITGYNEYYSIGIDTSTSTANFSINNRSNGGANLTASSGTACATDTAVTIRILVSAAGVITATINGSAPASPVAMTFTNANVIIPFFRIIHGAAPNANGDLIISEKWGLQ